MTRLSEALERARAGKATEPIVVAPNPAPEVPADWLFEAPIVDVAEHPSTPAADWEFGTPDREERHPPVHQPVDGPPTAAPTNFRLPEAIVAKLIVPGQRNAVLVEQYRRLAAVLHHAQTANSATRTVMIASAVPSEGKTLTATNLALTLGQSYDKRVLLIDADLRRPTLHQLFEIRNDEGLTTSLLAAESSRLPVRQVQTNLWLLTAGKIHPNPTGLLTSEAMKQLLSDAAAQFDWVVLDTPPVALMPDANLLAAMIDTAFVVVNAGSTPYPLVQKAVDAIGTSRVLGVVLNRVAGSAVGQEYGYQHYYDGESESPRNLRAKRFAFR
jgi:capsular exopolysaccharide synthesis family protein